MTLPVTWSPTAEEDRQGIIDHIRGESPATALRFVDALEHACQLLASMPELGGLWESRKARLAGVRVWSLRGFENHLLFYRVSEEAVHILRVVRGSRDLKTLLGG